MPRLNAFACFAILSGAAAQAVGQTMGPSTGQSPYVVPLGYAFDQGVRTVSIATNGPGTGGVNADLFTRLNTGSLDYRLVGIPDGMGAFRTQQDVTDGTFQLLVNHELGATSGVQRDHGNRGAFVSQWTIRATGQTFQVVGAKDLIQEANLWNIAAGTWNAFNATNPMPRYAQVNPTANQNAAFGVQGWDTNNPNRDGFGRFCSADLPAVSAFSHGGLGTTERIFMNGEEIGDPGRAFGHIVTGPNAGKSYELPRLGDFSWENSVASPFPQAKTVVIGTDDSSPGQVYVYIGNKTSTGNEIERAGLNNGSLYAMKVTNLPAVPSIESRDFGLATAGPGVTRTSGFTLHAIGDPTGIDGDTLDNNDRAAGVTDFLRPEDGVWDSRPGRQNDFYFVTTDRFNSSATTGGQVGRSRLYRMRFNDVTDPTLGGQLDMLMDGSEGQQMFDNMTLDPAGRILLQEDPGNTQYTARIWMYDTTTEAFGPIAEFDRARFGGIFPFTNAVAPFNQDEESSGIIDAFDILGPGWYLANAQAHYSIGGELVEGGQLFAMFVPTSGFTPIPEPATLGLLTTLLAAQLRRRR